MQRAGMVIFGLFFVLISADFLGVGAQSIDLAGRSKRLFVPVVANLRAAWVVGSSEEDGTVYGVWAT